MNVYRYARAAGLEGVTLPGAGNGQKRFYDVTAQTAIKQHFESKTATTVTSEPLHEALQCNGEPLHKPLQKPGKPLQSNGQTATGCNGSDDQLEKLHRLRQEVESLTADRDRLRDQLDDAAADRETLIRQVNQMRGEITGHAAEVKRLVDQLDQLRQDHREELDRIQSGHVAELETPLLEVVGTYVCIVLPKLYWVKLILGHQSTTILGSVDDAEAVLLTARYPPGRDVLRRPAHDGFSEGGVHGLRMLVLLSMEIGNADGHQQECYDE